MAHIRQSRPFSGRGFALKGLQHLLAVAISLGISGPSKARRSRIALGLPAVDSFIEMGRSLIRPFLHLDRAENSFTSKLNVAPDEPPTGATQPGRSLPPRRPQFGSLFVHSNWTKFDQNLARFDKDRKSHS